MPAWLAWALAAVALTIGEVLTPGLFYLGMIAVAAAAAMIAAALGAGWITELIVFAAASVGTLGIVRPIARRHLRTPAELRTGAAALVGAKALVVQRVDQNGGQVKIGGEIWSARTLEEGAEVEPGMHVQVAEIQGATAIVYE